MNDFTSLLALVVLGFPSLVGAQAAPMAYPPAEVLSSSAHPEPERGGVPFWPLVIPAIGALVPIGLRAIGYGLWQCVVLSWVCLMPGVAALQYLIDHGTGQHWWGLITCPVVPLLGIGLLEQSHGQRWGFWACTALCALGAFGFAHVFPPNRWVSLAACMPFFAVYTWLLADPLDRYEQRRERALNPHEEREEDEIQCFL